MNNLTDAVKRASWTCERFSKAEDGGADSTHLGRFIQERVHEVIHELIGVVNPIGELTNNPNHGRLGFRFIEKVEVFAKCGDNSLVLSRVSTENIFGDNNRLLNHVRDFRLDELQERLYTAIGGWFDFNGKTADGSNRFSHEIHIDFGSISATYVRIARKKREGELTPRARLEPLWRSLLWLNDI